MDELKVLTPEVIADNPFPNQEETSNSQTSQITGDTASPSTSKVQGMPTKRIAYEVIGSALNTKSRKILAVFEFTESGALQIGKYENGVSGDLRITPNGITARDLAGITTFAIDGTTGDAVFKGTIQAESLIAGLVAVGNNNVILDGENQRIVVNDGTNDRVLIGYQPGGF
jgi:hypothetical protein